MSTWVDSPLHALPILSEAECGFWTQNTAEQRKVLIPLIVACSLFLENMDSTVIATALPAIASDIGESPLAPKLALTSYLVGLAVFIPIRGGVADRLGSRTRFARATVVFV